jgi:hypothetical protein
VSGPARTAFKIFGSKEGRAGLRRDDDDLGAHKLCKTPANQCTLTLLLFINYRRTSLERGDAQAQAGKWQHYQKPVPDFVGMGHYIVGLHGRSGGSFHDREHTVHEERARLSLSTDRMPYAANSSSNAFSSFRSRVVGPFRKPPVDRSEQFARFAYLAIGIAEGNLDVAVTPTA